MFNIELVSNSAIWCELILQSTDLEMMVKMSGNGIYFFQNEWE